MGNIDFKKKKIFRIALIAIIFIITIFIIREFLIEKTVYSNEALGYKIKLRGEYQIDDSKEEIFTKLIGDKMDIIVFYDDFRDIEDVNYETLNVYGNKGIIESKVFAIVEDKTLPKSSTKKLSDLDCYYISYNRPKIEKVQNDKNNYITITIPRSEKEVYTLMIKSADEKVDYEKILSGFKIIDKKGEVKKHRTESLIEKRKFNEKTQKFVDEKLLSDNQEFGLFEETLEKPDQSVSSEHIEELEREFDYRFDVLLSYSSTKVFQEGFGVLKQRLFKNAKENNRVIQLTLSTFEGGPNIEGQEDRTLDILTGKYDDFLKEYADNFKKHEEPIMLRINNEMNGDWVSYCTHHLGKDPDLYIDAFRYIHDFFDKEGVDNLIYIFNPNEKSFPDLSHNKYLAYYPGDEYVDIIGLTAYNTGNFYEGEEWRSFDEAYKPLYQEYEERFSQPFMITEFSSSSIGGDKAAWFRDMFDSMKNYPKIKIAVLWNSADWDEKDGEKIASRPYWIEENDEVKEAVKEGLA
ncbi:MAG: glycosyl hydrolase, partial [Andreesenia angusta]|nr:glycosyl hydrolase [Andreesenia angusta]